MTKLWKNLLGLWMVLFLNPLYADWVCDPSCNLTISFPDGGSISTTESATLLFGEGAYVNDGAVTIGYAANENLFLIEDNELTFSSGGEFHLGDKGNLQFTQLTINTSGEIDLSLTNSSGTVTITGNLDLQGGGLLWFSNLSSSGSSGIDQFGSIISSGSALTVTNPAELIVPNNVSSISPGTVSMGSGFSIVSSGTFELTGATLVTADVQWSELSNDLSLFSGIELTTDDGQACTVVENQCISDLGEVFVLRDGQLVSASLDTVSGSSGSVSFKFIFLLCLVLCLSAGRSTRYKSR